MNTWEELSWEERTPEAGYREAVRRIEAWREGALRLNMLRLERIPEEVAGLTGLTVLSLANNQISDLAPLAGLTGLTILDLANNQISELAPLAGLTGLTRLYLRGNQISELAPLAGLTGLTELYLRGNQISELSPLAGLTGLMRLSLSGNQISELAPLAGLTGLMRLDLDHNQISKLAPLAGLTGLTSLDLQYNDLRNIRPLRNLLMSGVAIKIEQAGIRDEGVLLHDNPLTDPPPEIARQGTAAVLRYWEEIDASEEKLNEGRLLILGQGQVGKTSLLRKLQNPEKDLEDEGETHGINIWPDFRFPVPGQANEMFRASVWDFGGQDVQHESHQYFITPGTVFVLMINKRQTNKIDERQQLNYWLRIIAALGREESQKARVLVVNNVFADDNISFGIDLSPFAELYGEELDLSLHRVDLMRKPEELASLRAELQTALLELPGVGQPSPAGWSAIRAELSERRTRRRITFDEFSEVCNEHGKEEEASQLLLCNYLKNLGEILYYNRRETSNDIVLDINWVTKAIYGITTTQAIIDRQGQFTEEEIIAIWRAEGIERKTDHDLLLRLLKIDGFELCWNVRGTNRYLTPSLFTTHAPPNPPISRLAWA